jgi:hypothetical protein
MALAPLVLWRADVAAMRRVWWPAVEAGALWGLSGIGGYPALALGTAAFVAIWVLGRALFPNGEAAPRLPARLASAAGQLALLYGVGLLVLGPNYFAFFHEASGFSDRAGALPRDVAVLSNALTARAVATLSSPFLHLQWLIGGPQVLPGTDVSSVSLYLGAATLVFAAVAMIAGRRDRFRWWVLALGLLFLAFCMGADLPVRGWAYDLLPPTRYFRCPAFFRGFAMLAVYALALLGLRDLSEAQDRPGAPWRAFAGSATVLAIAALPVFFLLAQTGGRAQRLATAHVLVLWLGLATTAWCCARWPRWRVWVAVPLTALALTDGLMTARISAPTVWNAHREEHALWTRLTELRSTSFDLRDRGLARGYELPLGEQVPWGGRDDKSAVAKFALLHGTSALTHRLWDEFLNVPELRAMAERADRFYFAPAPPRVVPTRAAWDAYRQRAQTLGRPVLVLHGRADMARADRYAPHPELEGEVAAIGGASPAEPAAVEVTRYDPDALELVTDAPAAGWLLVTDRWAPGWQATVNGAPAELLGADFFFRAVRVEPGRNVVRMAYRPPGMPWLVLWGWVVLAAVATGSALRAWLSLHSKSKR